MTKRDSKISNISIEQNSHLNKNLNYTAIKSHNKSHRKSTNIFIHNYSLNEPLLYENTSMESTGDNFRNFQKNNNKKKNLTYNLIHLNKKKNNPIKPKHHLINSDDFSQSNHTNYSFKRPNYIEKIEKKEKKLISTNSDLFNLNNVMTNKKKIDINLNNIDITVPKKLNKSELFHNTNNNISQNQDQIISSSNRNFSSDSSNDQSGFILNKKKNKKMINLKLINKSQSSLMLKKKKHSVQDSLSQSNISNKPIFGNRNSVQYIRSNNNNIISSSNDGISTDTYLNNTYGMNNNGNLNNENEEEKIYRILSPVKERNSTNYFKKIKPKKMKTLFTHRNESLKDNNLSNNEMDIDSEMKKKMNKSVKIKSKTTFVKEGEKSNFMTKLKNWSKKKQFKHSHFFKLFNITDVNTFGQEEQTPKQIQDLKKGLMHNLSSFSPMKQKTHVSFTQIKRTSSEKSKSSANSKQSRAITNKNISKYSLNDNITNSNFEKQKHYTLKENNNSQLNYKNNFLIKPKRKAYKKYVKQLSRIPEISTRTKEKRKTLLVKQTSRSSTKLQPVLDSNELNRNYSNKSVQKVNTKRMLDNFVNKHSKFYFQEERDSEYESKSSYSSSSDSFTNTYKKAKSKYSQGSFGFFDMRTNSIRVSMKERKFSVENRYLEEIGQKLIDYFQNEIESLFDDITFTGNDKKDYLVNKIMKEKSQLFWKIEKKYEENLQNILYKKDNNLYNKNKEDLYNNEIFSPRFKEKVDLYMDFKNLKIIHFYYYENIIIPSFKFILNEKYLEVDIYEQIYTANYLLTDLNKRIKEMTLFSHFLNDKYKKKVTFSNVKKIINIKVYKKISKKSKKFYNRFLICDEGISDFYFNDINIIRTYSFNIESVLKSQLTTQNFKKASKMRLTAKFSSKKGTTNKTYLRSNSNQNTPILYRNMKNNQENHKNNTKQQIWRKSFFIRKRDFLANNKLLLVQKKLKIQKEKYRKKIQKKIYSSPLQLESNYYYYILNQKKFFNKESILFQTHKIKSDIIKGYSNYSEIIFFYVKDNNFQSFKELYCKFKINPEIKDEDGNSLLNLAVQCDSYEIIDFLLSSGALPNSQNKKLNTPLHYALTHQNFKIADLLIKNGADENIKNKEGLTPWQCINSKHSII